MPVAPGTRESYIGVFLGNILYGFYLSVFLESSLLLWRKQKGRGASNIYVIATSLVMFILITMRCVIDTVRCIVAFDADGISFGPPNTTLGVIYRTFIVWKRNWLIIILPTLLSLANFASAIWILYSFITFDVTKPIFGPITMSINAFSYLTLFTNLLCSALISFRILSIRRKVTGLVSGSSGRSDDLTTKVVSIMVESGAHVLPILDIPFLHLQKAATYTLLLVVQLVTSSLNSYISYIATDCTPATIGIVFSYIIIRVSRGSSYGDSTVSVPPTSRSRERGNATYELSTRNQLSGTRTEVQVKLERTVHQQSDADEHSVTNSGKYVEAEV
ncbi:hypothetical protein B0H16DRAFT_1717364 [Mycena metata]|uniref:Uncharacterized protein n=1 Tax=Mycena metata TaxID=1033252 RepID=A0AAD7JJH1_9AGAR|nr:hypothetical protein B0H16DRAFT_1717364 [Mycena metata]